MANIGMSHNTWLFTDEMNAMIPFVLGLPCHILDQRAEIIQRIFLITRSASNQFKINYWLIVVSNTINLCTIGSTLVQPKNILQPRNWLFYEK